MRLLTLCFVLLWMTTLATPALAVTPQTGDLIFSYQHSIVLQDAQTGALSTVSCWDASECSLLGSGPGIPFEVQDPQLGPDGGLFVAGGGNIYRVDIATGDREQVSLTTATPYTIYPAPSFFSPPAVASLGTWGLAMLLVGIFIGVQLRNRRTAKA